ncbi:MAG: hypothetical protein E6K97_08770 [Thaumarchaeota archaeon]|nr:MAG: hypothetical protein E6K97_08770 [Nitrososphaerota archaeon]
MQKQEQEVELFLDSVKSEHTKRTYKSYLKKYMELTGLENLLHENNPRLIEKEIREFIIKMKKQGMTFTALKNYTTVVFSFYKIHDIVLNITKISKFMPENRRVKKDRGKA